MDKSADPPFPRSRVRALEQSSGWRDVRPLREKKVRAGAACENNECDHLVLVDRSSCCLRLWSLEG